MYEKPCISGTVWFKSILLKDQLNTSFNVSFQIFLSMGPSMLSRHWLCLLSFFISEAQFHLLKIYEPLFGGSCFPMSLGL